MESILFPNGEPIQQEKCAARSSATGNRFDALGGHRLATHSMFVLETSARIWAGRMCSDLGAFRLNRSAATLFDDPLDLEPNPPRQNGSISVRQALNLR